MTLDIAKFIANSIRTQAKIHHLDLSTKALRTKDIPNSVKSLVIKQYGEKYLDDADYVAFFWGGLGKDEIDKLFNVVDKALGKSANKLTDKDFKKLDISEDANANENQTKDDGNSEKTEDGSEEIEEIAGKTEEIKDNDADEASKESLNEQKEEEIVAVEVADEDVKPTAYFFLKITIK